MKYEIIKGSEKDFEGAPEWCTIIYNYGYSDAIRFCNGWKEGCKFSGIKKFLNRQYDVSASDLIRYKIIAERRPINEPELKQIYGDGIHDDSDALQQRIDMGIDVSNIIGKQGKLFNISKPLQFGVVKDSVVNQLLTTEWDGKGLPPVGVECEILWNDDWVKCVVKAYGEEQLIFKAEESREWAGHINNYKFRPIRSPEDVARSNAIGEMERAYEELTGRPAREAEEYYDLIAAGKIIGIKLEN